MLSRTSLEAISWAIKLGCLFKSNPYNWDEKLLKLSICPKSTTRFLFKLSLIGNYFHFSFALARVVSATNFGDSGSASEFLLQLVPLSAIGLNFVLQTNTARKSIEGCRVVNCLISVDQGLAGNCIP
jgi:hypothetical protein